MGEPVREVTASVLDILKVIIIQRTVLGQLSNHPMVAKILMHLVEVVATINLSFEEQEELTALEEVYELPE